MKCDSSCNTEDHHIHEWYYACEKRIEWDRNHASKCKFGIGLGQIHPDMDPNYLVNNIFWNEPQLIIQENRDFQRQQNFEQMTEAMERLNKRNRNGLDKQITFQNFSQNNNSRWWNR